jgi:hypothetical protein
MVISAYNCGIILHYYPPSFFSFFFFFCRGEGVVGSVVPGRQMQEIARKNVGDSIGRAESGLLRLAMLRVCVARKQWWSDLT